MKLTAVRVWFDGATAPVTIGAEDCFVGPAGELKLFIGERCTTLIAPRQWVFCELVREKATKK